MTIPGWLLDEIATVPDHAGFLGVDALHDGMQTLAARYPGLARFVRVGSSQQGEPIVCLVIGDEDLPEALVFGLPHPNEPIGGLTALHLAERLCADPDLRARLGHRWRIVACVDPDGLRLNERWLDGPLSRAHYSRWFYRPAGQEQVEWAFPLNYKEAYYDDVLPESLALVRLIDEHRPAFMASLHNSELGGAYYYLSRAEPPLHGVLQAVPEHLGIPLDRGEPESPHLSLLDTAIYHTPPFETVYDDHVGRGEPWVHQGGSAVGYAMRWGALTLLPELPYWIDPRAGDDSPSDTSYAEALAANADALDEVATLIGSALLRVDGKLTAPNSPFWRATRFFAPFFAAEVAEKRERAATSDRVATVAEVASLRGQVHLARLRFGGMLLRALTGEEAVGNVRGPVRAALAEVSSLYEAWVAEDAADLQLEPIPIKHLVSVQYAAVLASAAHLAGRLG